MPPPYPEETVRELVEEMRGPLRLNPDML